MVNAPTPVLLLHGMGCGPWVWRDVVRELSPGLSAISPAIAGHHGGRPLTPSVRVPAPEQMVDDLEAQLDLLGVGRIHVVGNSLGGWLGLRLAERGRASSVLCLAPAGGWGSGSAGERLLATRFALGHRLARRLAARPSLLERRRVRTAMLSQVVRHPLGVSLNDATTFITDLAHCQALQLALGQPAARRLGPIGRVDVPVTIAWSADDKVLSGPWARGGFSHLTTDVLDIPHVGHIPMLDSPRAVARLIEDRIERRRGGVVA